MACASASRARAREVLPNGLLRRASLIVADMGVVGRELFVLVVAISAGFSEFAAPKLLFPVVVVAASLTFGDPLLSLRSGDVNLGTEGDMSRSYSCVHGQIRIKKRQSRCQPSSRIRIR